jgi:hypothetical protein
MAGATTLTAAAVDAPSAALPLVCGALAAAVARGRAGWLVYR